MRRPRWSSRWVWSVDGNALAVGDMMGAKSGSAEVEVDGNSYTITGEAQGADIKNPMAGMITKTFDRQGDLQLIRPIPEAAGVPHTPAASYDCAMAVERARPRAQLTFAADEIAAKELLLPRMPQIEEADRDDLMLEVFAQLGEIYLVRTAYDGVEEAIRRIDECLAIYSVDPGGHQPGAAAKATMADADIDHMICRYSRRAQFLETGLAAARTAITRARRSRCWSSRTTARRRIPRSRRRARIPGHLRADHVRGRTVRRRPPRAVGSAVGEGDRRDRSCGRRQRVRRQPAGARRAPPTGGSASRPAGCPKPNPGCGGPGPRAEARGWELATARTKLERATAFWLEVIGWRPSDCCTKHIRRSPRASGRTTCRGVCCTSA